MAYSLWRIETNHMTENERYCKYYDEVYYIILLGISDITIESLLLEIIE